MSGGFIDSAMDAATDSMATGPMMLWAHPDSVIIPQEVRDRIAHAEKDKRRWRRFLRRGVVVRGVLYRVVS